MSFIIIISKIFTNNIIYKLKYKQLILFISLNINNNDIKSRIHVRNNILFLIDHLIYIVGMSQW